MSRNKIWIISSSGYRLLLSRECSSHVTTYFRTLVRTFESMLCRGSNIQREINRPVFGTKCVCVAGDSRANSGEHGFVDSKTAASEGGSGSSSNYLQKNLDSYFSRSVSFLMSQQKSYIPMSLRRRYIFTVQNRTSQLERPIIPAPFADFES